MRYKVSWKLTDDFIDLCTKNGNKDINITSDYEFEKDEGNDFSSKVNKLVELCCSYYPNGEIYYAEFEDFKSGYVCISINKKKIEAIDFEIRLMPWYAVQSDDYTDWDDGSYDLDDAFEMARSYAKDGKTGIQIAVIRESTNFCVNGYVYDEESDRFILDNDGDRGFLDGFPVVC